MFPTLPCFSKASRRALTPKRGNKDFYKGTGQAFLPGGHRTGAPGKHVRGSAKYRLLDEKVRVFIAPPLQLINESPLKPYVALDVRLTNSQRKVVFGNYPENGLTPEHYLKIAQARSIERAQNQLAAGKEDTQRKAM